MKKHHILSICIIFLMLILLACETSSGYSETGAMTQSSHVNGTGSLTKTIRKANGSTTTDLGLDDVFSSGSRVRLDVTLEIEGGAFKVEFLSADEVALTLQAAPGSPAQGQVVVEAAAWGEIRYRVTAENTEKVKMTVKFEPN